jgi:hypothetical protein
MDDKKKSVIDKFKDTVSEANRKHGLCHGAYGRAKPEQDRGDHQRAGLRPRSDGCCSASGAALCRSGEETKDSR